MGARSVCRQAYESGAAHVVHHGTQPGGDGVEGSRGLRGSRRPLGASSPEHGKET